MIAFFVLSAPVFAEQNSKHVYVIYNLLGASSDPFGGNPEHTERNLEKQIESVFPGSEPVVVRSNSSREVEEILRSKIDDQTVVDGLTILSHGYSYHPKSGKIAGSHITYLHSGGNADIYVFKTADGKVVHKGVFPISILKDKWAKDAKVVLIGCKTATKDGSNNVAVPFSQMTAFAEAINLKSGTLYMNETLGTGVKQVLLDQPWQDQKSNGMKALGFVGETLGPLADVAAYFVDNTLMNQGYLLSISDTPKGVSYEMRVANLNEAASDQKKILKRPFIVKKEGGNPVQIHEIYPTIADTGLDLVRDSIETVLTPETTIRRWREGPELYTPALSGWYELAQLETEQMEPKTEHALYALNSNPNELNQAVLAN